jgi:phage I-like protein
MQAREDDIWALVEWTEKAAAHIKAREYRYLSPVLFYPDSLTSR